MSIYPIKVVRYGLNTLPNTPVCLGTNTPVRFGTNSVPVPRHDSGFGTTSIPVPGTSVRVYSGYLPYQSGSVRPQYATEHSGMLGYEYSGMLGYEYSGRVRYEFGTGTRLDSRFGTTSIPVPNTSVSSVRHPYRYLEYRYRTEHTLGY